VFVVVVLFIVNFNMVFAKRVVPHARPGTGASLSWTRGVPAVVEFNDDRNGIIATFTGLSRANTIYYELTYNSDQQARKFNGTIPIDIPEPVVKEFEFGVCTDLCVYDTGIRNAKFVLTSTLKNGSIVEKTFFLKTDK
jgi:hypothetical protein